MLKIDDPIAWMNADHDGRVLDLWIADMVNSADDKPGEMKPAEKAFKELTEQCLR